MPDDLRYIKTTSIAAGVDRAVADELERELRRQYGGTRHYIAKTSPTDRVERPRRDATD